MGERKVQAKYYPPDFDPSKLPRIKKKRQNDEASRFMLPMSVRCETCGEFMGTGLKFNARKSDTEENYLGIRIFRFSMKCKSCPATFIIKTDPKNSDYICESGVRRNYEPWRDKKDVEDEGKEERKRQDEDAMQALENKTRDAKQEMEDLDALDELKALNAKRATLNLDDIIANQRALEKKQEGDAEHQLRAQAEMAFHRKRTASAELKNIAEPSFYLDRGTTSKKGDNARLNSKSQAAVPVGFKIVKKVKERSKAARQAEHPGAHSPPASHLVPYTESSSESE